jgi:Family of unknown function (DUF6424)
MTARKSSCLKFDAVNSLRSEGRLQSAIDIEMSPDHLNEMSTGNGKSHQWLGIWSKILTGESPVALGRAGLVPVIDDTSGVWRVFRNSYVIHEGAETALDPPKVDLLRENVQSLLERYPATVPTLEKLGVRTKALVNREIKTYEDVEAWSNSIFNIGPVATKLPVHVADTLALAYDDLRIRVRTKQGGVAFVVPAGPRGSGSTETIDFTTPGRKTKFGPWHPASKAAFAIQTQAALKAKKEEAEKNRRPRGRPRSDGLVPGSKEARAADEKKRLKAIQERRLQREARRAERARLKEVATARAQEQPDNVIQLRPEPPPENRRKLRRGTPVRDEEVSL